MDNQKKQTEHDYFLDSIKDFEAFHEKNHKDTLKLMAKHYKSAYKHARILIIFTVLFSTAAVYLLFRTGFNYLDLLMCFCLLGANFFGFKYLFLMKAAKKDYKTSLYEFENKN